VVQSLQPAEAIVLEMLEGKMKKKEQVVAAAVAVAVPAPSP
jgi:hypothetical protein